MKTQRYLIKQLTSAEVGETGTHETYVRCPNDFNFEDFFQQKGALKSTVIEIKFTATDLTVGETFGSTVDFRFVYYVDTANKEKRIPGLTDIFRKRGIEANDYIKLESVTEKSQTRFYVTFLKPSDIKISSVPFYYSESVSSKPELVFDAGKYQEYVSLLIDKHNLVLTGAPGTGKTFMAKQIAASIISKGRCGWADLTTEERSQVGFTQFHPSYDYTDFVEGLRPNEKGHFVRTDGVFKHFCKEALEASAEKWEAKIIQGDTSFKTIYQTILDDVANEVTTVYKRRNGSEAKLSINANGRLVYHMAQAKTQSEENLKVLYEYFLQNRIFDVESKTQQEYNNLIEQLTADRETPTRTIDYVEYAWTLQRMLDRAQKAETEEGLEVNDYSNPFIGGKKPYIFIIDEINRGELSKIFGELFYSIEPDYRGRSGRVTTQYNNMVEAKDVFKDGFYIPENVYIIGTMNDIDRGVEAMDFAIRRRFAWKEVTAEDSAKNMELSEKVKYVMTKLNEALKEKNLTEAHYIGGAYFLKLDTKTDYQKLWDNHLKGIIAEYFRGEPDGPNKLDEIESAYKSAHSNPATQPSSKE